MLSSLTTYFSNIYLLVEQRPSVRFSNKQISLHKIKFLLKFGSVTVNKLLMRTANRNKQTVTSTSYRQLNIAATKDLF